MNEEIGFIIETANESMRFSIEHLERELLNIRAGRANPVMLERCNDRILWCAYPPKSSLKY